MLDWLTITNWSILLVDDEIDNLEVIAETLEFMGLTVRTASNGIDALELPKSFNPTLILVDLSMPTVTGWVLRTRIKGLPQRGSIPIVALTAHAMAGDKERVLEVGFDGYMTKPISVPTILEDLRAALTNFDASKKAAVKIVLPQIESKDIGSATDDKTASLYDTTPTKSATPPSTSNVDAKVAQLLDTKPTTETTPTSITEAETPAIKQAPATNFDKADDDKTLPRDEVKAEL